MGAGGSDRRRRSSHRSRKPGIGFVAMAVVALLLGAYLLVLANSRPRAGGDAVRVDTFFDLIQQRRIRDARLLDQDGLVVGSYVRDDGSTGRYRVSYLRDGGALNNLIETLITNRIPTTVDQQFAKSLLGPATVLLPALIVVVVFIYLILSYQRGSGLFGVKSGARRIDHQDAGSAVSFDEVAGQDRVVAELREIRDFLAEPERFAAVGARVPKGILLFGPPGCGKTMLARAVAGESGAAFYSISGSDFVELYVGVGASRVRDLFREAREHAPAVVFVDELDSVGSRRGGNQAGMGRGEHEQALNQLLAEMDGFSPMEGIIVIGATNRPDVLDPALLRPGRFDRTLGLERPDEKGRLAILAVHAKDKQLGASADLGAVAKRAIGLSGADLASVMNEAALLAARREETVISKERLNEALSRILEAPERQRRLSMRSRTFGRSSGGTERVHFADVAGASEVIAELAEVRDYLAEPDRFVAMGARPPRGVLLVGPPGCGKTLVARALATEANAAFFSVASTEFVEVFAGEGASRVRDLFAEARAMAPAIVFLDEVDAVGLRRGASLSGQNEREQTLNQILIELDGFEAGTGVIALAATNRPDMLDEALVRPGRFDRTIALALPDLSSRLAILAVHARGKPVAPDVDLEVVAGMTLGFSGADLANVLNEAALLAARRQLSVVPMAVVEEAVERAGAGVARGHPLSERDRVMVAYHEVGHALVGRALAGARAPHKVSIVARGSAMGATWHLDRGEQTVHARSELLDQLAALLGGRAAEELVFGEPASGAADDLRRVDETARRMVCEWGMGEGLGPRSYADATGHPPAEAVSTRIDAEVGKLIDEAYRRASAVLGASRAALERGAKALLARETLTSAQLDEIAASASSTDDHCGPARSPIAEGSPTTDTGRASTK